MLGGFRDMSDLNNIGVMKPEDLTLELFSLQLELDQVPFGDESRSGNAKLSTMSASTVSTTTTMAGHHLQHTGHMFDQSRYQQLELSEPMLIDNCHPDAYEFQGLGYNPQKSSDEGTVIDEDLMDVFHQSLNECANNTYPIEVKEESAVILTQISQACTVPLTISLPSPPITSVSTPAHSNGASPCGSQYGGHSSQGGPPTPPSGIPEGKKKKLKTRHARDSTYSQIQNNNITQQGKFNPSYESPPTPATPTTTPISSCPSSPGLGGYHSRESVKSTSSRGKSGDSDKGKVPRHKRASHIKAEYKRRNKIQVGIEELQKIVPTISDTGGKESKSSVLNKAVDYCHQLVSQTKEQRVEMERLRAEIEALRGHINSQQEGLPATGAKNTQMKSSKTSIHDAVKTKLPITCQQMFNDYVSSRSLSNWKFWIFGLLMRPLFESYESSVQTSDLKTFCQGVTNWCKQHCSLISLRPAVFNFLRSLADRTSIRTNPEKVPEEVVKTVIAENFPSSNQTPNNLDKT